MRAVLAVHNEQYDQSSLYIDQTRQLLDVSLAALLTESYGRAYVPLILVQQCSELEGACVSCASCVYECMHF